MNKLLVARSWAPPAEECPVSTSGINVSSDPASSTGVHPHRNTGRLAMVTAAARSAVQRQATATSTIPAADHTSAGPRWSSNGCPDTSETVSGTSSAAHTVHTADAAEPTRSAR